MTIEVDIKRLRQLNIPVMFDDGTVDLSATDFSAIDTYLRCGEQYRLRYIKGKRSPPGLSLVEGTAHHKAMEEDNKSKLNKGKALKAADMTGIFEESFKKEIAFSEKQCEEAKVKFDWECEDEETVVSRAKPLHASYEADFSKGVDPVAVEDSFSREVSVDLDGRTVEFRLHGATDVEDKHTIFDYKTSSKAKSPADVAASLQLTGYSWARRKTKVTYIVFVKKGKPLVQRIDGERHVGHWAWGLRVFATAVEGIRRGVFPLTNPGAFPRPWWCSPDFCGYWAGCRGKYEAK